ncbi:hypothetical protein QYE76_008628 [Lolium multiflorum]|uniref:Uncharacterized protein n=1 Tax=Lolium multiflorum TaxID=4521 RepID=A0AAD8TRL9_LOLMU|nr:hypothetical protein QYE76_008628 [Lolium multiflorum]
MKHGRLWLGDGCVDPATIPYLRQIRRGRKSGQPQVETRPRASDLAVERLRAEMAAKEQEAQEQRTQMEQQILDYQQHQAQMMQQMQQQQEIIQQHQAQMNWLMSQTTLSSPPGSLTVPPFSLPWMPPPSTQSPDQDKAMTMMPAEAMEEDKVDAMVIVHLSDSTWRQAVDLGSSWGVPGGAFAVCAGVLAHGKASRTAQSCRTATLARTATSRLHDNVGSHGKG